MIITSQTFPTLVCLENALLMYTVFQFFYTIHFSIFGQFFELSRRSVSCPYVNKLIYCEFVAPYIKRVQI